MISQTDWRSRGQAVVARLGDYGCSLTLKRQATRNAIRYAVVVGTHLMANEIGMRGKDFVFSASGNECVCVCV